MIALKLTDFNGIETVDSRQVAEAVEKNHANLMREIRTYCGYLTEINLDLSDFFIENSYQDSTGRTLPCYLITRKGCEMIANKMTGQKGVTFTALYINAFHSMERQIQKQYTDMQVLEMKAKADRAYAMKLNAENRRLKMLLDNPHLKELSPEALATLGISRLETTTGQNLKQALPQTEQTFSATEVGQMLGISANKVGKTANAYQLKTEEYGIFVLDKSRYSDKQVTTFRYYMKAVQKLAETGFSALRQFSLASTSMPCLIFIRQRLFGRNRNRKLLPNHLRINRPFLTGNWTRRFCSLISGSSIRLT